MSIPFWFEDPTVLFNQKYIGEIWPTNEMSYEQKLNAITRLIILLTILGYVLTLSIKLIFVLIVTLIMICLLYMYYKNNTSIKNDNSNIEGMINYNEKKSDRIKQNKRVLGIAKIVMKNGYYPIISSVYLDPKIFF